MCSMGCMVEAAAARPEKKERVKRVKKCKAACLMYGRDVDRLAKREVQ